MDKMKVLNKFEIRWYCYRLIYLLFGIIFKGYFRGFFLGLFGFLVFHI